MRKWLLKPAAKPILFVVLSLPFCWLFYGAFADRLGANPAEYLSRATGDWTLRLLCAVLALPLLRQLSNTPQLMRFSRMFGLFAYFYALLHFVSYAWFDKGFEFGEVLTDIAKRPFILVGFLALVLLTPLAVTSFNRAIRGLGVVRWKALHRIVYLVALLALLHFFWMRAGKNNFAEVFVYAAIIGGLLSWRLWQAVKKRSLAHPADQRAKLQNP